MINKYNRILLPFFFLIDLLLVCISFVLAYYIRFNRYFLNENYRNLLFVASLLWVLPAVLFKTYHVQFAKSFKSKLKDIFFAELVYIGLSLLFVVLSKEFLVSRLFLVTFFLTQFILIIVVNMIRNKVIQHYRKKGYNNRKVIVIGDKEKVKDFISWSKNHLEYGYKVEKYICYNSIYKNYPEILEKELNSNRYDEVIIISGGKNGILIEEQLRELVDIAENHGLRVMILTSIIKNYAGRVDIDNLNGQAVLRVRNEPLRYLHNRIIKRSFDILFSLFILLGFYWWIHIMVAILIKLTSRGPVLFKQKRVGVNDEIFTCLKFRTMRHDNLRSELAENGFDEITDQNDNRVTWIGRFLRKTNLDELPQFINVIKGDMSVVGPRPHMLREDLEIRKKIPKYRIRQFVKPGITGLAAVNGFRGGNKDIEHMRKRTEIDIWYIENWSLLLDLKIIAKTIWQMVTFRVPNAY
ncbi:MAG: exopolysaccharide biosynthesis polyprenyl glycosylphosphotransferase [Candidatus Helarchaeota archaeon]